MYKYKFNYIARGSTGQTCAMSGYSDFQKKIDEVFVWEWFIPHHPLHYTNSYDYVHLYLLWLSMPILYFDYCFVYLFGGFTQESSYHM